MSTGPRAPATFSCSSCTRSPACNYFCEGRNLLGTVVMKLYDPKASTFTRATWRSFVKFLVGHFRERLVPGPVRANGSSGSLHVESNPALKLIGAPLGPAPTTTVDVLARVITNHTLSSFIAAAANQAEPS